MSNSEGVHDGGGDSCPAALSSVDNFSYGEGSGTGYVAVPATVVGIESDTSTRDIGSTGQLAQVTSATACETSPETYAPFCATATNEVHRVAGASCYCPEPIARQMMGGDNCDKVSVSGVVSRAPPSAALGRGSQEPGKEQCLASITLCCSIGHLGLSTEDEVCDFAATIVELRQFSGLVEFSRRLGDLPIDFEGTVHYDPSGSGILSRILASARSVPTGHVRLLIFWNMTTLSVTKWADGSSKTCPPCPRKPSPVTTSPLMTTSLCVVNRSIPSKLPPLGSRYAQMRLAHQIFAMQALGSFTRMRRAHQISTSYSDKPSD